MSARQAWIVSGSTGEYSDATDWSVRVFTSEQAAKDFAAVANDWLRECSMHRDNEGLGIADYEARDATHNNPPEWDPGLRVDYTGTAYTVFGPVPLIDEVTP